MYERDPDLFWLRRYLPEELRAAPVHYVSDVSTAPQERRLGYATELLRQVAAAADEEGAVLGLYVCSDDSPGSLTDAQLVRFYEKIGFRLLPAVAGSRMSQFMRRLPTPHPPS